MSIKYIKSPLSLPIKGWERTIESSSLFGCRERINMTKKVLWFSRHEMTPEQLAALGDVEINQINRSISSAYELEEEINNSDIIAIVAPINLQQQFLKIAGDKPVIMAVNDRRLIPQEGGEDKVEFHFVKWEQLDEIIIKKHDFVVE